MTVASLFLNIEVTGFPTISLRPRTTAFDPAICTPVDSKSWITADGVHGAKSGNDAREERWPIL